MNFLKTEILLHLFWICPILAFLYVFCWRKREKTLQLLLGSRATMGESVSLSLKKRVFREILFILALLFVFLAAARPSWGNKIISVSGSGRDIIIAVDVSKSMLATDIQPSRLEHAKWFLRELIASLPGDRFGIVVFAGNALLQCPLTIDRTSLIQLIGEFSPDLIPIGGTNIEKALETAMKSFDSAEGPHRAIVLLSDGEELYGNSDDVIEKLKSSRIPVYTVGLGNPIQKTPISIKNEKGQRSFLRDEKGEIVSTKLDEEHLTKIAVETGGTYVRSTVTEPGLMEIIKQVKSLASEKYKAGDNLRPIERFQLPLFIAIFFLLARLTISERRKIALFTLCLFSFAINSFPNEVNPEIEKQSDKKEKASTESKSSSDNKKLKAYEIYNQAHDKHTKAETTEAKQLYQSAISSIQSDPESRAKSFQNLGVINHEEGRKILHSNPEQALKILEQSQKMYREAMREKEIIPIAAKNQQLLLRDIEKAKELIKQKQEQKNESEKVKDQMQKAAQENEKAQKSPQDKKQKENAIQQNQKAQDALENYKNKIPDEQNQEKQNIQNAINEMKKAENEQKKENFDQAKEHIEQALKEFSKNEKENKQTEKQDSNTNENNQNEESQEQKPNKQEQKEEDKNKNLDPAMAETLLEQLIKDENKLREEMLKREQQNFKTKKIEKDW